MGIPKTAFQGEAHAVSAEVVDEVSKLVVQLTGNQIGDKQSSMVQARMSRRLIELRMGSEEYLQYLRSHLAAESKVLISLLTTHHTYFFREFSHFEYLATQGLRELTTTLRAQGRTHLRVWSAACSFGHEVYSLSMALKLHLKQVAPDFTYEILGTDIDSESVALARNGVYRWEEVKTAPAHYLADHWVRGTEDIADFVKAKKSIKDPLRFGTANLLKLEQSVNEKFDVVFCRNVLIYFNQEQVQGIIKQLLDRLEPHGYLFLGISESIMGTTLPIAYAGPAIYRIRGAERPSAPAPAPQPERTIRVLCVDDSLAVLSLLKKIFEAEPGFQVVATAKSGLEAAEKMKGGGIDAMTLDIHMPEQTGIEYLEKSFNSGHVPVVMVTSVSREESALGLRCLKLGASDFVEKPALADLEKRGEELRMKLRCAVRAARGAGGMAAVARSFSKPQMILRPETKARIVVCSLAERAKLVAFLKLLRTSETALKNAPPLAILMQGGENVLSGLLPELGAAAGASVEMLSSQFKPGGIYLSDFNTGLIQLRSRILKRASVLVIGDVTGDAGQSLASWVASRKDFQLIAEDQAGGFSPAHRRLQEKAAEQVPVTSFVHSSDVFLGGDA